MRRVPGDVVQEYPEAGTRARGDRRTDIGPHRCGSGVNMNLSCRGDGVLLGTTVMHKVVTSPQLFVGMTLCGEAFSLDDERYHEHGEFNFAYGRRIAERMKLRRDLKPCLECKQVAEPVWRAAWRRVQRSVYRRSIGVDVQQQQLSFMLLEQ